MKSEKNNKPKRPFWLNMAIMLGATTVAGLLLSVFEIISLSNVYFISGAVYLLVAAVPVFTELGGNARSGIQARREGKHPMEAIRENEASGKYTRGTRITFLFGLSGFICFGLAILTT